MTRQRAIVCCEKVADRPAPYYPDSTAITCRTCGAAIWIHLPSAQADLAGAEIRAYCADCLPDTSHLPLRVHARQIDALRAQGVADADIVAALALGVISAGNLGDAATIARKLRTDPNGWTAARYRATVAELTELLAALNELRDR